MMELPQPAQARVTGGEQHVGLRTDEKRERAVGEESLCKRRDHIARTACNLAEICRDAGLENASGRAIIRLLRPHNACFVGREFALPFCRAACRLRGVWSSRRATNYTPSPAERFHRYVFGQRRGRRVPLTVSFPPDDGRSATSFRFRVWLPNHAIGLRHFVQIQSSL